MTMREPFVVTIGGMPQQLKPAMEHISKTIWMRMCTSLIIWKICFGIVPYFLKEIKGTAHRYPVVPKISQGRIITYEDDDRTQVFEWEWNKSWNRNMKSPPIYWAYTGYEPDFFGNIRTPIMACLEKYRMLHKAREDLLYANYHASHPMLLYEDRPPVNARDDGGEYDILDCFQKDTTIPDYINDKEHEEHQKIRFSRTKELEQQLIRNGILNDFVSRSKYQGPVLYSDNEDRDLAREQFVHNRITLPMDRHFAGDVKPSIIINIELLDAQLAKESSEIIGIPPELTQNNNRTVGANREGVMLVT